MIVRESTPHPKFSGHHRQAGCQAGITLVEVMVSLLVGLIVIGAMLTLLVNTRGSFQTSENQARMLENARFALFAVGRDLRHSGSFGPLSWSNLIFGQAALGTAASDCGTRFYIDMDRKIFGSNDANPFAGTCIPSANYQPGTDVLVVRYAEPTPVTDADTLLSANRVFLQSKETRGDLFMGGATAPTTNPDNNFQVVTNVYYVNPNTNPDDGIPSLHRISLQPGATAAEMEDEMLVSGVENLQVQYGLNECTLAPCSETISRYVDAGNAVFGGALWPTLDTVLQIEAVRVWLLIRARDPEPGLDTTGTFNMGSKTVVISDSDSIRRMVYPGLFYVRNRAQQGRVAGL